MELLLNGSEVSLAHQMSVEEFLQNRGFDLDKIAVEIDGEILVKSKWQSSLLVHGSSYEVVEFVGGG